MPARPEASGADAELLARARELASASARTPYVPVSAYRLQFNGKFPFAHAAELLDYFAGLGVDALYCSPYFQAAPGSMHGYDIVDPTRLNAELGPKEDYEKLCSGLEERRMGHILDVVPNHMGIAGNANAWWLDVLENGASSAYAHVFDIDWNPVKPELKGRVLLPVLGELYGKVLEAGELSLAYEDGAFQVRYWEHRFPVDPKTYPLLLEGAFPELEDLLASWRRLPAREDATPSCTERRRHEKETARLRLRAALEDAPALRSRLDGLLARVNGVAGRAQTFDELHRFLEAQPYRLAYWGAAADEINYRRFFDINALAAVRIEDERVFDAHHAALLALVRAGRLQGLRVDHPDGLYDPPGYFDRLQKRCLRELVLRGLGRGDAAAVAAAEQAAEAALRDIDGAPFYVVAEKILDRKEELSKAWSIAGTVGYGALNALNGIFVDRSKESEFDKAYAGFIGHVIDYEQLIYDKKKFFALVNMASEVSTLAHRLDRISEQDRTWRDLTYNHLTLAVREALACFPVYRSYISPGDAPISEGDRRAIRTAIGKARGRVPALHPGAFDFLERVLLVAPGAGPDAAAERLYRDFTLRFQQLSGPIMAKGVEDTSFYVFNRLLSLNEVGGDPTRFGWQRSAFHEYFRRRQRDWPAAMVESSTHDTKRSEDVRMRLNVISEIPLEWQARLNEWGELNGAHKTPLSGTLEPRRNTEYFVYQTLLGVWPNETLDAGGRAALLGRVWEAVLKSSREAKSYTNWSRPDADYEEALRKFTAGVVANEMFLAAFLPFQEKVAFHGMLNSLSALALKLAAPGVPDTYQGNELWDYCLVDPDNRRRVDFDLRARHLRSLVELEGGGGPTPGMARGLLEGWRDGRIKLHLLRSGLRLRRREREVFLKGDYLPLEAEGARQRHVTSFMRRSGPRRVLAAGGRFFTSLLPDRSLSAGGAVWQNTVLVLPDEPECAGPWRDVFTGERVESVQDGRRRVLEVPKLFGVLSAALLINDAG